MTVQQAIQSAAERFAADLHLRDAARRDAEMLLMHTAALSKAELLARPNRELTVLQREAFGAAIARRLRHEPIQYITGQQEFYGLALAVTPAVLIPRPETEHLVEAVLDRLPKDRSLAIADIGTGSGAIAIALASQLPQTEVTAVDLSPAALAVAEGNARTHLLDGRIRFLLSDLLEALPPSQRKGHFDAIASNPPYVSSGDSALLHPQVREHEPASALYAGADGLDVYRRLVPQAEQALKPGGLLALEIGHGQREAIAGLLAGWEDVCFVDDLQGIPRVALARRPVLY
ncbi:MAG: peptide chain release factor N(5)-glutamine methyltransferase [Acidobacteria bacterium]|nr:peptide chain release factor N(5)-glutamine methyltransferase [Acidobacteriota bacterium]